MSPKHISESAARKLARYYRVLEIGTRAPAWAIKRQYRRLAKIWHPDKHASDPIGQKEAEHRMKLLTEAYDRIRDAPLRFYQLPKAPKPKATPATPRPRATQSTPDIDLSALNTPTPSSEREIVLIGLGCLGVPTVLALGLITYALFTYGIDFFVRAPELIVILLPAIITIVLFFLALWELTGFGDWLVKKIWG